MFDILFQNKKSKMESYMDIISVDGAKLLLSKFAIEKAVGMIANAIAKSEFVVQRGGKRVKDDVYWRLNIQPNDNETATDFWRTAVRKLLITQESLVCTLNGKFYIVDSYTIGDMVLGPNIYTNITISCNEKTYRLNKQFMADEILHFRTRGEAKRNYLEKVMKLYDLSIIMLTKGIELDTLKIESAIKSEDIKKIAEEIFTECAMAFDIPVSAFLGTITEKSDATNEFITYAVSPVKEIINDPIRAKLVGQDAFTNKGDDIWIDISHFKHVDILDSAAGMDKLRSIGFNLDELRQTIGWEPLNTEFSQERVVTKNYTTDLEGGDGSNEKP